MSGQRISRILASARIQSTMGMGALAACLVSNAACGPLTSLSGRQAHEYLVFVDRSCSCRADLQRYRESWHQIVTALAPGDHVVLGWLGRDTPTNFSPALSERVPAPTIWDNQLLLQRRTRLVTQRLENAFDALTTDRCAGTTPILDTTNLAAQLFTGSPSESDRALIFLSDMVNDDGNTDFAHVPLNPRGISEIIARRAAAEALPDLEGVSVYAAGPSHDVSPSRARAIERFWREYFGRAGAAVLGYGPLLLNFPPSDGNRGATLRKRQEMSVPHERRVVRD